MADKPMQEAQRLCESDPYSRYKVGNVPLPERGMPGDRLTVWWVDLVSQYRGCAAQRDQPRPAGGGSYMEWKRERYAYKCGAKNARIMLAMFHAALAPDAPFVCDENCPHVANGIGPEQIKQFIDPLKADIEDAKNYLAKHWDADWAADERDDETAVLTGFLKLLDLPDYEKEVLGLRWEPSNNRARV